MSVCQCVNCEFGRKLLKRSLERGMIEEGDIYPHQFATHPKISLRYCKVLDLDFMKINHVIKVGRYESPGRPVESKMCSQVDLQKAKCAARSHT